MTPRWKRMNMPSIAEHAAHEADPFISRVTITIAGPWRCWRLRPAAWKTVEGGRAITLFQRRRAGAGPGHRMPGMNIRPIASNGICMSWRRMAAARMRQTTKKM